MGRRTVLWLGQLAVGGGLAVFLWRRLVADWERIASISYTPRIDIRWILVALLCTWAGYTVLVLAWRQTLGGWNQRIAIPAAARVWFVGNLGRYLPGKVWSIAGLSILAQREGVSGWAAAGAALVMQVLSLGTGAVIVAGAVPDVATGWHLGATVAVATGMALALSHPPIWAWLMRRANRPDVAQPLPLSVLAQGALATVFAWLVYGLAFWALARGVGGGGELTWWVATGVFTAGYIVGFLALFAPGGIGVREVMFVGLLANSLGATFATLLAVSARLMSTVADVGAAVFAIALARWSGKEIGRERHDE